MKNKNMVLMVIAVGIGLAAAFVTSQLGAKTAAPEMVKLIVAKKELPVGTLLVEKKLNDMVGVAEFPKNTVPPEAITDVEKIKEKRLTRTLRVGDKLMPNDLNQAKEIQMPKGHQMYTLKMDPVKAVAGFALPGSRVDLLLTETKEKKSVCNVLLRDMLVVAVDVLDSRPEGAKSAVPTLNSVSLAVTPQQGQLLALAAKRGDITLMLRDPESTDKTPLPPLDRLPFDPQNDETPVVAGPKTVKIPVAKVEIASNTKVTKSNFDELFSDRDFVEPLPPNAARNKDELVGKVLMRPLDPDQFVPLTILSDHEAEDPAPAPAVDAPKPIRHELTIQNGANVNRFQYEKQENGFRLVTPGGPMDAPEPRIVPGMRGNIEPLPNIAPAPRPMIDSVPGPNDANEDQ